MKRISILTDFELICTVKKLIIAISLDKQVFVAVFGNLIGSKHLRGRKVCQGVTAQGNVNVVLPLGYQSSGSSKIVRSYSVKFYSK